MIDEKDKKESGVLNNLLDYQKWTFKVNWTSGVALVAAIIWAVTMTVQNSGYKAKIDGQGATISSQGKTISTLSNTVSTLEGSMNTVNNTIRAFTENPPSALEAKIDNVKFMIEVYHGQGAVNNVSHTPVVSSPIDSVHRNSNMTGYGPLPQ